MGYARGLIRYTSERALAGGKTHWLRPRLVGYASALLLMIGGLVWGLQERSLIDLDISRDRSVFRANSNGDIENIYTLKVLNKTQQPREYSINLEGAERFNTQGLDNIQVAAGETRTVAVRVSRRDPTTAAGSEPLQFVVQDLNDATSKVSDESTFVSPAVR